ncbi:MAG TPA: GntR family transcriptional regulator [Terriglobales bacterium]|jgi:GntR family transcriptional regulator|nr:GntR family transcriptional regulator [Terriglobales bacterium]
MLLNVNASSGVPLYLQVESQVKYAVASGAMRTGDPLPSVRKLAAELRMNPNTVARAYQDLEREGVIRTVPGGGTFVADSKPGLLKSEKLRRLRPLARQLAVESMQLRMSEKEVLELLQDELETLGVKR